MGWIIELAKLLGYALVVSLIYVSLTAFAVNNSKATGFAVIRAHGYSLMLVGAFIVVLGFVLTRIDLVMDTAGRTHLSLR